MFRVILFALLASTLSAQQSQFRESRRWSLPGINDSQVKLLDGQDGTVVIAAENAGPALPSYRAVIERNLETGLAVGSLNQLTPQNLPDGVSATKIVWGESLLVGTESGLFRSRDGGLTFDRLKLRRPDIAEYVHSIALDATNNRVIYVTNAGRMMRSTDGGDQWTIIENGLPPFSRPSFFRINLPIVTPARRPGRIYVAWNFRIFFSDNRGDLWTELPFNLGVIQLVATPSGKLLVQTPSGIYYSADEGKTWLLREQFVPAGRDIGAGQNEDLYYADGLGLYRSLDYGSTWIPCKIEGNANGITGQIRADAKDPRIVLTVGQNGLYRSQDGGASFALTQGGQQALGVAIDGGRVALGRVARYTGALAKFDLSGQLVFATFTPGVLVRTAIGRTGDIYLSALRPSIRSDQTEIWKLSPQGDLLAKLSLDARVATLEVDSTGRPVMCVDRKRILRLSADLSRIDAEEPLDCELVLPKPDGGYWWKSGTFPGTFGFLDSNLKLVESRDPFLNGWVALGIRSVDQQGRLIATVLGLNTETRIVRLSRLDRSDAEFNLNQLGVDIVDLDLVPTADDGLILGYKRLFRDGSPDGRIGKLAWGDFRFAFSRSDKWYGTSQAPRVVSIGTSIVAARSLNGTLNVALWEEGPPNPLDIFELYNFLSIRAFSLAPEATVWLQWPGVDTFDQYDVGFNTGRQLPTEVFGASVLFDGEPGLLSYVNRGMIRVTAPRSLAGKSQVSIRMRKAGALGPETVVRVSPVEIGVGPWVLNEAGRQEILKPGEYMSVYVTGLGGNRESGLSLRVNYQPVTDLEVIDLPGYIPGFKLVMGRVPAAAANPQGARQTINLVWRDPEGTEYSSNLVYSGS